MVGVIFYIAILKRTSAATFYQLAYPVMALFLIGGACLLYFDVPQTVLSITLTLILAFLNFAWVYNGFLATAAISPASYGFYGTVKGYIMTLSSLISYVLIDVNTPNNALLFLSYALLGLSVCWSLWFRYSAKDRLMEMSHPST